MTVRRNTEDTRSIRWQRTVRAAVENVYQEATPSTRARMADGYRIVAANLRSLHIEGDSGLSTMAADLEQIADYITESAHALTRSVVRIRLLRNYIIGGDIYHPAATSPIAERGEIYAAQLHGPEHDHAVFSVNAYEFTAIIGRDAEVVR